MEVYEMILGIKSLKSLKLEISEDIKIGDGP